MSPDAPLKTASEACPVPGSRLFLEVRAASGYGQPVALGYRRFAECEGAELQAVTDEEAFLREQQEAVFRGDKDLPSSS
jgi:hypothetical protein